ncbi:MAG: peroxiredoxin [Cyclobacteriaceae bacterium]
MALKVNQIAPDFTLPSTSGQEFSLFKDGSRKPCILYFYPKDFTPGCTKEACEFRDSFSLLRELNVDIYGISQDNIKSHIKFKEQYRLPFDLLADTTGKVSKLYHASLPFLKINRRITYLLDRDRKIRAVYEALFGAGRHAKEMISRLKP